MITALLAVITLFGALATVARVVTMGNRDWRDREVRDYQRATDPGARGETCPSGMCISVRNAMLTGSRGEAYAAYAREQEEITTSRLAVLVGGDAYQQPDYADYEQPDEQQPAPGQLQLGEGSGVWVPFGRGAEVRQDVPVVRSLWDAMGGGA